MELTTAISIVMMIAILIVVIIYKYRAFRRSCRGDTTCETPLPPGTMGVPFFGETYDMVFHRAKFLESRYNQYGRIFKTHLFGTPTVRVSGAENVRQILQNENKLVAVNWPKSVRRILGAECLSSLHNGEHKHMKKVISKAFSREALANYVPVMVEEMQKVIQEWLQTASPVLVYPAIKLLMFRIAMRLLLGFEPEQMDPELEKPLLKAFEQMIKNLFSLPLDIPFTGLYRGIRARNIIHAKIEENLKKKMAKKSDDCSIDALQLMIDQMDGETVNMKAMKESATELLFGGHGTTASVATSLVMFLGLHQEVVDKVRIELDSVGLLSSDPRERKPLTLEILQNLNYTGCVLKEALRMCPPVAGGFRVALKTFDLDGFQIPKGWNVLYSIADTHKDAEMLTDREAFDPDRFMAPPPGENSRFDFIPFGGGARTCVGKEFAKILLKTFIVELCRTCDWDLVNGPPIMKTDPIISPMDDLPTLFTPFGSIDKTMLRINNNIA